MTEQMVDLYHRTSPTAADAIMAEGFEGDVVYALKQDFGQGYGPSRIHLRVPKSIVQEDEEMSYWDDGTECDDEDKIWFISTEDLEPEHIIGRYDDCKVCEAERRYAGDHATADHVTNKEA